MEKLVPGYYQGQTNGILMVQQILLYLEDDMKRHKMRWNKETFDKLFKIVIDNRAKLRENPNAFVRCTQDKEFEVYSPERRQESGEC